MSKLTETIFQGASQPTILSSRFLNIKSCFPDLHFAAYQPTLFEIMGIPREGDKIKRNSDSGVTCTKEEQHDDNAGNSDEEATPLEIEGNDNDHDDDDGFCSAYIPEREYDDRIHRLEWNNGARDRNDDETGVASGSILNTVLPVKQNQRDGMAIAATGEHKPLSFWDDLFDAKIRGDNKTKPDTGAGLDDLLCLFEDEVTAGSESSDKGSGEASSVDLSVLSQDARVAAKELVTAFSSRGKTTEALERSCPNWKENICFAMLQKDPNEVREALENVQNSRMRMRAEKERMLRSWECKNTALEVFEKALKASSARLG